MAINEDTVLTAMLWGAVIISRSGFWRLLFFELDNRILKCMMSSDNMSVWFGLACMQPFILLPTSSTAKSWTKNEKWLNWHAQLDWCRTYINPGAWASSISVQCLTSDWNQFSTYFARINRKHQNAIFLTIYIDLQFSKEMSSPF